MEGKGDGSFTSVMTLSKRNENIPEKYVLPPLQRSNPTHNHHISTSLPVIDLSMLNQHDDIEKGSQVMAVNCYPSCPEPDLALGMPPHTDYGTLTIINQSQQGLEIMDQDKQWHSVPFIQGALIVQLGDQFEVMSNGRYKSTLHRAVLSMHKDRLSIASLHSMPIEKKVGPAQELVDEQHPVAYKEGSFGEFLNHISMKSLSEDKYIDTQRCYDVMSS